MVSDAARTGYAPVNGLNMYYEQHGDGPPLLLLHGAFMTIELMADLVTGLSRDMQVIAVELQAHGRTADIDRPLSYAQLADDVAALLLHLRIARADVFGYSLGGGVALQLAMRHSSLVRKLVAVSASISSSGVYPEVWRVIEGIKPELFDGTPWRDAYDRVAPDSTAFSRLVDKLKELDMTPFDWPADDVKRITAPTMVVIGDSDGTTPEHAVHMFRLRGGGVFGDIASMPASQLAILPGTNHVGMLSRTDWLVPMVRAFLNAS
jgi:pimeloyl-ACP methyl ester carboxylesterase